MKELKNKLKDYINENSNNKKPKKIGIFSKIKYLYFNEEIEIEENSYDTNEKSYTNNLNIQNYIEQHKKFNDFQTLLFKLIDDKNLKDSDVYNKVHLDRRLFSKIRSDKKYHPSKETIILLAISLELKENELEELLESASYSLPKNNKFDLIIRFCFINKIYKLKDINELLNEYNCKLFNY